jgi:hypothetical protein
MARVTITFTDTLDGGVDFELIGSPSFDPNEKDPEKLSGAQRLATAVLRSTGKHFTVSGQTTRFHTLSSQTVN